MIIPFYTQRYRRSGIACPDFLHLHYFCVTALKKPSGTPKNLQNHWKHCQDVELWSRSEIFESQLDTAFIRLL